MEKLKSINVNSVFDKKVVLQNLDKVLYTVSGYAYSQFIVSTKYGENLGFKGDFVAVNKLTGEVFESDACFLPKSLAHDIAARLEKSENQEVRFTADIKATASDKNDRGYAWIADAPRTEEMISRREQMKIEALQSAQKVLAAPKNAKTKAA